VDGKQRKIMTVHLRKEKKTSRPSSKKKEKRRKEEKKDRPKMKEKDQTIAVEAFKIHRKQRKTTRLSPQCKKK